MLSCVLKVCPFRILQLHFYDCSFNLAERIHTIVLGRGGEKGRGRGRGEGAGI
jgi:hypothetical protein